MKIKNGEIELFIKTLEKFLDRRDIIGYAAARNTRILTNAAIEYFKYRDEMINKYGEKEKDENGNETGRAFITGKSKRFKEYTKALTMYAIIEHEVTIFKIPYKSVCGKLTGAEILDIDWMLEDSDEPVEI